MHKYIGYGNMFCWHCGKRVHLGKKFCPHCGARYNGTVKHSKFSYPVNKRISPHVGLGPFHFTFVRFLFKYIIGSIITAIIVLGVIYMVDDYDEGVYEKICLILCSFWVIWLAWYFLSKALAVPSVHRKNNAKAALGDELDCACCHNKGVAGENYCDLCGTVLYYDHNGMNQPPVEPDK